MVGRHHILRTNLFVGLKFTTGTPATGPQHSERSERAQALPKENSGPDSEFWLSSNTPAIVFTINPDSPPGYPSPSDDQSNLRSAALISRCCGFVGGPLVRIRK